LTRSGWIFSKVPLTLSASPPEICRAWSGETSTSTKTPSSSISFVGIATSPLVTKDFLLWNKQPNGLAHLPPIIARQLTLKITFSTK
jgi:hypothetical protein